MTTATEWSPGTSSTLVRDTLVLFKGTSVTANTIASTGSFTFTTQPNLYFAEDVWVIITDAANADNWLACQVTSYNTTTGVLVVTVKDSNGSGTISNWTIYITGAIKAKADDVTTAATQSSATDITLIAASARLQTITMTAEGNYVILPDATTLVVTSAIFTLHNAGYYPFGVKDGAGVVVCIVAPGGTSVLSVTSIATTAGTWIWSGNKLVYGMTVNQSILSAAYGIGRVHNFTVGITDDISIHFASLALGGLAVFYVDNSTKAISTPATITITAATVPKGLFKIDSTRAMVFYGSTLDELFACVVSVVAGVLTVGMAASTGTVLNVALENGYGDPRVSQLDTNLFLLPYVTANGAGSTSVIGCQVSGSSTVTFGVASDINVAADNLASGPHSYPLTTTTGLVLYKRGTVAPFTAYGVVINVTNSNPPVCTVNTPTAYFTSTSAGLGATMLLSATEAVVTENSNIANSVDSKLLTISGGITVTANALANLETAIGTNVFYTSSTADRTKPHLFKLSATSFLWWCKDSTGVSRVRVCTISGTTITPGLAVVGSFSAADIGDRFTGTILSMGTTEFIGVMWTRDFSTATNSNYVAIAHKISGNAIIVGMVKKLDSIVDNDGTPETLIMCARLANGNYAICGHYDAILGGDVGIELLQTDGINIIDKGVIPEYATDFRSGASGGPIHIPFVGNRLLPLGAAHGIPSRLRVANIITI